MKWKKFLVFFSCLCLCLGSFCFPKAIGKDAEIFGKNVKASEFTSTTLRTIIKLHTSNIFLFRGSAEGVNSLKNRMRNGYITDVTLRAYVTYSDNTSKIINLYSASGDNYSSGYDGYKFSYATQITGAGGQDMTVTTLARTDSLFFYTGYPASAYLNLKENNGKYLSFVDETEYTGSINPIADIYFKADMLITNTTEGEISLTGLDVDALSWSVSYSFPEVDENYNAGFNAGYETGYNSGYNEGYSAGASESITTGWFLSFVDSVSNILSIEIFPAFKLVYLLYIPVGLGLILLIFKMIRG